MKTTVGFVGKLSLLILVVGFMEVMFTAGRAADFESYPAIGWVFQCLMFCVLTWCACEWEDQVRKERGE